MVIRNVGAAHRDAIGSMRRYFAELGERFDGGFDPGDTLTADASSMTAPHGAFLVGYGDGAPVVCGGVLRLDDDAAEIKRMWVDPAWRGLGLGPRLLGDLESHATQLGCRVVRLDTNAVLVEAIAMYERFGYRPIERYNDNPYAQRWFEKQLESAERT